jgi:hypothetical protein
MPIINILLLASMSLGTAAQGEPVASGAGQFTQNCQISDPRLERLASAIQRGDLDYIRSALDEGLGERDLARCPCSDMPLAAPEDRLARPG